MDWTGLKIKEQRPAYAPKKTYPRGERTETRQGTLVMWCDTCGTFVDIPGGEYTGECPRCSKPMFRMRCTRCGAEWYPRNPKVMPGTCPKCKSPYYNRTRVKSPKRSEAIRVSPERLKGVMERMEAGEEAVTEGEE